MSRFFICVSRCFVCVCFFFSLLFESLIYLRERSVLCEWVFNPYYLHERIFGMRVVESIFGRLIYFSPKSYDRPFLRNFLSSVSHMRYFISLFFLCFPWVT